MLITNSIHIGDHVNKRPFAFLHLICKERDSKIALFHLICKESDYKIA